MNVRSIVTHNTGSNPVLTTKNKFKQFNKMSHRENARTNNGKEWWGKRPLSHKSVSRKKGMKFWKRLLHKIERRMGKKEIY